MAGCGRRSVAGTVIPQALAVASCRRPAVSGSSSGAGTAAAGGGEGVIVTWSGIPPSAFGSGVRAHGLAGTELGPVAARRVGDVQSVADFFEPVSGDAVLRPKPRHRRLPDLPVQILAADGRRFVLLLAHVMLRLTKFHDLRCKGHTNRCDQSTIQLRGEHLAAISIANGSNRLLGCVTLAHQCSRATRPVVRAIRWEQRTIIATEIATERGGTGRD